MTHSAIPGKQGLYDPQYEHDSCGVGFVVDLQGRKSHTIVQSAIQVLLNLEHRGACGCEKNTGDGAGILMQVPHAFLAQKCDEVHVRLPEPGAYGVGMVFLPTNPDDRRECEELFDQVAREEGQRPLGWRTVRTDGSCLGATSRRTQPVVRQVFIGRNPDGADDLAFERKLYVIRKRVEKAVRGSLIGQRGMFYVPSLSYKTIIYKGML